MTKWVITQQEMLSAGSGAGYRGHTHRLANPGGKSFTGHQKHSSPNRNAKAHTQRKQSAQERGRHVFRLGIKITSLPPKHSAGKMHLLWPLVITLRGSI